MELMDARKTALIRWLQDQCAIPNPQLLPLVGDASTRRYYRINNNEQSFIVMDAPPREHQLQAFIAVANALLKEHVHAPFVHAAEVEQGFMLLEDFGDVTLLKGVTNENADRYYQQALRSLATMQTITHVAQHDLPLFGEDWLWQEWDWHKEWFLKKAFQFSYEMVEMELDEAYAALVSEISSQPTAFMYRDFHSANMMMLPDHSLGFLDFQDAFIGPITYDAASFLRDCYIDWPEEKVQQWLRGYFDELQARSLVQEVSFESFKRWFDFSSVQRHLKALLTFARKSARDNDHRYLQYIPRTLKYIECVTEQYPELSAFYDYYTHTVAEKLRDEAQLCAQ